LSGLEAVDAGGQGPQWPVEPVEEDIVPPEPISTMYFINLSSQNLLKYCRIEVIKTTEFFFVPRRIYVRFP
jgi:hypothetical protein